MACCRAWCWRHWRARRCCWAQASGSARPRRWWRWPGATSASAPTPPPRWWSRARLASAACWRCRQMPRLAWRSCCSATRSAWPTPTWWRRRRWPWWAVRRWLALHRPLCAVAFDPGAARSIGVAATRVQLALLGLLAAAVAVAVRGLGTLLVLAVLVAPAVAARRHAARPGAGMALGAVIGGRRRRRWALRLAPPGQRRRCIGGAGAVRRRGGGRGAAGPQAGRGSPRAPAQADEQRGTERDQHKAQSCGCVRPATTASLRRMNSISRRSVPASTR